MPDSPIYLLLRMHIIIGGVGFGNGIRCVSLKAGGVEGIFLPSTFLTNFLASFQGQIQFSFQKYWLDKYGTHFSTPQDVEDLIKSDKFYDGKEILVLDWIRPKADMGVHQLEILTMNSADEGVKACMSTVPK